MNPIWCSLAALAVALCYLVVRAHQQEIHRRQRVVRQRVALLLWAVAHHTGEGESLAHSQGNPV